MAITGGRRRQGRPIHLGPSDRDPMAGDRPPLSQQNPRQSTVAIFHLSQSFSLNSTRHPSLFKCISILLLIFAENPPKLLEYRTRRPSLIFYTLALVFLYEIMFSPWFLTV